MDTDTGAVTTETPESTGGQAVAPVQEAKGEAKEPDYQRIIGLLQTENARLKAQQSSNPDIAKQLEAIQAEQRRTRRQLLELADIDQSTKQSELAKIDTEEGLQRAQTEWNKRATRIGNRILKNLEKAGIAANHPKVAAATLQWQTARTIEEMEAIEDALTDFVLNEKDTRSKAEIAAATRRAQEIEQKFKVENGALAPTNVPGTPGGNLSLEDLTKPLPRDATLKQVMEREAELNAALGLHRR